jgi:hypothetical protein
MREEYRSASRQRPHEVFYRDICAFSLIRQEELLISFSAEDVEAGVRDPMGDFV